MSLRHRYARTEIPYEWLPIVERPLEGGGGRRGSVPNVRKASASLGEDAYLSKLARPEGHCICHQIGALEELVVRDINVIFDG